MPRDGVLYVQSSMDWVQRAGFDLPGTLRALTGWLSPGGMLVMPSYPFRTTHVEYMRERPLFDVARTPARIGLLPEVFRRFPQVVRSLAPDYCVAALGNGAAALVENDLTSDDPFGPGSAYQVMLRAGTTLVGLGVSLNTNSFIHAIDAESEAVYGRDVYFEERAVADVIDRSGHRRQVARRVLRPEFQRLTAPGALAEAAGADRACFAKTTVRDACFFRWDLTRWAELCRSEVRRAQQAGRLPVWLHRLEQA